MTRVLGVDGAADGWFGVLLVDGYVAGADLKPTVAALLDRHPDAEVLAVDVPIGLPVGRTRPADDAAKRFVGGERAASVFPTFPRDVLMAKPYAVALEAARRLGTGLSRQAYALSDRIDEVAGLAAADQRVVEVHPEVSFRAMKGTPLRYSKHTWSGLAERRALLASVGILLHDDLPGGERAAPDDVVDAAAAAWSAMRVAEDKSSELPAEPSGDAPDGRVIHYQCRPGVTDGRLRIGVLADGT